MTHVRFGTTIQQSSIAWLVRSQYLAPKAEGCSISDRDKRILHNFHLRQKIATSCTLPSFFVACFFLISLTLSIFDLHPISLLCTVPIHSHKLSIPNLDFRLLLPVLILVCFIFISFPFSLSDHSFGFYSLPFCCTSVFFFLSRSLYLLFCVPVSHFSAP